MNLIVTSLTSQSLFLPININLLLWLSVRKCFLFLLYKSIKYQVLVNVLQLFIFEAKKRKCK
jgi:hypothetical protein